MAFRKKVKKLFSKLHHNNDAAAGPAAVQPDTTTPPARRASVANAAEPSRPIRARDARPPPLISKASAFPIAITSNYRPTGVVADLGDKFLDPFSKDVDGATETREDGYILPHPGQAAGPAFVQGSSTEDRLIRPGVVAEGRNTSVVTVATTASSDYDQHCMSPFSVASSNITNSWCSNYKLPPQPTRACLRSHGEARSLAPQCNRRWTRL
jgi:hypothetical protein